MTADSAAGRVVLELGPGVGALIIYAPSELEGNEIEISQADDRARAAVSARSHALVRRRQAGSALTYAAVYQTLQVGSYVVWRDRATALATVTIAAGQVTTWRLPARVTAGGASGS